MVNFPVFKSSSWSKQPNQSFIEKMRTTPLQEKIQVKAGSEVLERSSFYDKVNEAVKAYKSFYNIPKQNLKLS